MGRHTIRNPFPFFLLFFFFSFFFFPLYFFQKLILIPFVLQLWICYSKIQFNSKSQFNSFWKLIYKLFFFFLGKLALHRYSISIAKCNKLLLFQELIPISHNKWSCEKMVRFYKWLQQFYLRKYVLASFKKGSMNWLMQIHIS